MIKKTSNQPMRRTDRETSEVFARHVAMDAPYGTLVTATNHGEPYGVPVSPVIEGNVIWFHAAADVGRKFEILSSNPRCAMLFVSESSPDEPAFSMNYRSAMFEGHATLVTDQVEKMHALWLICSRWASSESLEKRRKMMDAGIHQVNVWRIDVTHISGKMRASNSR